MTQADLYLDNQPGASFRAELNTIIEALATNNAGTLAPTPAFPSMWWSDFTANLLKRRRKDNTAWFDVAPIDEAFIKATIAEVLAGTEATKGLTAARLATIWKRGTDVASGAALDLTGLAGYFFHVTGSTAISSITGRNDGPPLVLYFEAACQVTHGAALILPGAANFNAQAGDAMLLVCESAGNWRAIATFRGGGTAVAVKGQCRVNFINSGIVRLERVDGHLLTINGVDEVIPAGGVDLSNTAIGNSVFRYIYAFMNAGVMTLEASATAPVVNATNGQLIKTGDATRSFVAWLYTNPSGAFQVDPGFAGIRSHYNKRKFALQSSASGAATGSTTPIQIGATVTFIAAGPEPIIVHLDGYASNNTQHATCISTVGLDGSGVTQNVQGNSPIAGGPEPCSLSYPISPSFDSPHGMQTFVNVSSGVGTWFVLLGVECYV
jgi:hypothetical protein